MSTNEINDVARIKTFFDRWLVGHPDGGIYNFFDSRNFLALRFGDMFNIRKPINSEVVFELRKEYKQSGWDFDYSNEVSGSDYCNRPASVYLRRKQNV